MNSHGAQGVRETCGMEIRPGAETPDNRGGPPMWEDVHPDVTSTPISCNFLISFDF